MPVCVADADHEVAECDDGRAADDEEAAVAGIPEGAGEEAEEDEDEGLDAADEGDEGGVFVGEGGGGVVGVEDAEGVGEAEGVEPGEEGAEDLQPCGEAAIGGRLGRFGLDRVFGVLSFNFIGGCHDLRYVMRVDMACC